MPIQFSAEVQEAAALGGHGATAFSKFVDLFPQRPVLREGLGVRLGEPAAKVQGVCTLRKGLVGGGVEDYSLGSGAPQKLQVLLVDEAEGWTARDRNPHRRRLRLGGIRNPGLHTERTSGSREAHDFFKIAGRGGPLPHYAQRPSGLGATFGSGDETQMPVGGRDLRVATEDAEDGDAERF